MCTVFKANKVSATTFPGTFTISPVFVRNPGIFRKLSRLKMSPKRLLFTKNAFFAEKDTNGNRIDYVEAVRGGLTLTAPAEPDTTLFGTDLPAHDRGRTSARRR